MEKVSSLGTPAFFFDPHLNSEIRLTSEVQSYSTDRGNDGKPEPIKSTQLILQRSVNMAATGAGGRSLSVPNDMQSVNDILRSLEEGSTMTAFFKTKKPESSLFRVKLETRELIGARIPGLCLLFILLSC